MNTPWTRSYLPLFRKVWKTLRRCKTAVSRVSGYIPVDSPGKPRNLDHTGNLLRAVIQPGYSIKQSTAKGVLGGGSTKWNLVGGLECGLSSRKTKR